MNFKTAPGNIKELVAILTMVTPAGCYADIAGQAVWIEQIAEDDFAVVAVPHGDTIDSLVEWADFDTESESEIITIIQDWQISPRFGLLESVEGYEKYERKPFVVSSKKINPFAQHEEWNKWVMTLYICIRKHDSSIPDNVLESMRDILLSHHKI